MSSGGEIKINVIYKDRVPDLLSRFPEAIRKRAARWFWWPNAYERKVLRACKDMPRWARLTVRQHLLHERAVRIQDRLDRLQHKRELREARRKAKIEARQAVREMAPPTVTPVAQPTRSERDRATNSSPVVDRGGPASPVANAREVVVPVEREGPPQRAGLATGSDVSEHKAYPTLVGGARHAAGSALGAPVRGRLTLTERLAQTHGIAPVEPRGVLDRGRGR